MQNLSHYAGKNNFITQSVNIEKGDSLFFFSDGYPDQYGGPNSRKYGPKRMRKNIKDNADQSADEMIQFFDRSYHEWMGEETQLDDVLVVGIDF